MPDKQIDKQLPSDRKTIIDMFFGNDLSHMDSAIRGTKYFDLFLETLNLMRKATT